MNADETVDRALDALRDTEFQYLLREDELRALVREVVGIVEKS